jgi:hypothetical protein
VKQEVKQRPDDQSAQHPGQRRRRLLKPKPGDYDFGNPEAAPRCSHCGRLIIYGKVLSCGPVMLHESCLKGWRDRSALPLL